MNATTRPVREDDAPAIGRILKDAGRRPWGTALLAPSSDRIALVAEQDGVVVACARTDWRAARDAGAPAGHYFGGMVVAVRGRRQGIGRALVDARLSWLRGRTDVVHSIVNAGNVPSIRLHASSGFVEVARGARFGSVVADREGDELVLLRRDLERHTLIHGIEPSTATDLRH